MLDYLAKKGVFRLMPGAPFGFDESKDQRHAVHIPLRHKGLVQPFEDTNNDISALSRDGRFVAINPKFAELAGLSKAESIEKTPEIFFPARDVTKEYRRQQERTAKLSKANADPKKEIAQRRLAEENIHRAKREWEATFDAVSDLILITDLIMRSLPSREGR